MQSTGINVIRVGAGAAAHSDAACGAPGAGTVRQEPQGRVSTPRGPSVEVAVMHSLTRPDTPEAGAGRRLPATVAHPGAGLGA
jgi:hypothetical protein